jgi:hypothetical protein
MLIRINILTNKVHAGGRLNASFKTATMSTQVHYTLREGTIQVLASGINRLSTEQVGIGTSRDSRDRFHPMTDTCTDKEYRDTLRLHLWNVSCGLPHRGQLINSRSAAPNKCIDGAVLASPDSYAALPYPLHTGINLTCLSSCLKLLTVYCGTAISTIVGLKQRAFC